MDRTRCPTEVIHPASLRRRNPDSNRRLNEALHISDPESDFDLGDPYNHHCSLPVYHPLHDPHARQFLECSEHYQVIQDQRLVTAQGGVLCSLKEFNDYRLYLHRLKTLQNDRKFAKELADVKKRKEQKEKEKEEILFRQNENGESVVHARKVRARREMINEQFLQKCLMKQAEEEVQTQERLREHSTKRAEKDAQRWQEWRQRHYRVIGKQKLDNWNKIKQREQTHAEEKEREHRMEVLGEQKRKRQHAISECRWLQRCERQHQQIMQADAKAREEAPGYHSLSVERNSVFQSSRRTEEDDDQTLLEELAVETTEDGRFLNQSGKSIEFLDERNIYGKEQVNSVISFPALERSECDQTDEISNAGEFCSRSCHNNGQRYNFYESPKPATVNPENFVGDSFPPKKKNQNGSAPLVEGCWPVDGDNNAAASVWQALVETVIDGVQMCTQHSFALHSAGRIAKGEIDEALVSQVAEEVGRRALDAITSQLMTMVAESATIPALEVLESLVSHVNDLIIDLTWDLSIALLQEESDHIVARYLWRETILRAACELGRQAIFAVVVWMCNRKVKPADSSSSIAFVCACILAAIVSRASYSDILQELLDPTCQTQVGSLLHSGLLLTDEVITLAESQLWQHLDKNGNNIPSSADNHQMACRITQAILVHADNNAQMCHCDHQSKELVSDCVLDSVICNLQACLLAGHISATNSLHQPLVTCEGDSLHRTRGTFTQDSNSFLKKKLEEREEAAAELCASAIEHTFSSLQYDKCSAPYEEYCCTNFSKPVDPLTCEPLDEVLIRTTMDAICHSSAACLKHGEIPLSGSGIRAVRTLARQIAMQGVSGLRAEASTHSQASLTFTSGRALLNVVRWRVKNKSYGLEKQILRSLADADVRKVQQLIELALQFEHLNDFCLELRCLLDKDRKCVTRRQTKALVIDNLALHAILSRERMLLIKLVTGNIQDNIKKTISNGLLPSRKLADAMHNYTFSVVVPKAVGEMELQLTTLLATPNNQNADLLVNELAASALINTTDTLSTQNDENKEMADISSPRSDFPAETFQKSGTLITTNLSSCRAQLSPTTASESSSMLHLQNLIVSCLLRVTDKEVRKLITEYSSSQVSNSTGHMLEVMAGNVVEQAINETKTQLLNSGSDLIQLWESPLLESVLEGAVILIKKLKTHSYEVEDTDKHINNMTIDGLKLLCELRGEKCLLEQDLKLNVQSDNKFGSHTKHKQSRNITSIKTKNHMRENFIPLLVEIILNGALSSEIFSKPEVTTIVLARCECFVEKLIEELAKISMLSKDCISAESLADKMLGKLLNSIIRGAFNSSNFLLEDTSPKVIARSANLIHNITDNILHVHSVCSTSPLAENCFDIVHITESIASSLIETALTTKTFTVSTCPLVVKRSEQMVQRILEKFAIYKCNSDRMTNMIFPYGSFKIKNQALVSSLVSKSMLLLEQGLNSRKDITTHQESASSFKTADTSQSSDGLAPSRTWQTESTSGTAKESTSDDLFYDTKKSWSGSTPPSYTNDMKSSSQSFLVGETTTDCSGVCFKLSGVTEEATSDDTVSSLPTAMAISEVEERSSLSYQSHRSCSLEIVKLMEGVISGSRKGNKFKHQIENLPNTIEMSSHEIDQLVADIATTAEHFGLGCDLLPFTISSDESKLEIDTSRSVSLLQSCLEEKTSASSEDEIIMGSQTVLPSLQVEQDTYDIVRIVVCRAFRTVLSKPCNRIIKQLMPSLAEIDTGNKKEIETILEDALIDVINITEKDAGLTDEEDDFSVKTICEDLIIDLVERMIRESLRCELAVTYENWTTTMFANFTHIMKSITVDTMLRLGTKMELFLSLDGTSATQLVKRTANEIFRETVDDVHSCCCSHLSETLTQEMSAIAAEVAQSSVENVLATISESSMQIARWQPSALSLTNILENSRNLAEMLPKPEEKLMDEITCTTVANLQRRMSEIIKAKVDDVLHQDTNDLKIKAAGDQIGEVNRILSAITDNESPQPADDETTQPEDDESTQPAYNESTPLAYNESTPPTRNGSRQSTDNGSTQPTDNGSTQPTDNGSTQLTHSAITANWENDCSVDDEVIVVEAVLGACQSLTRLSAQSRIAGLVLDSTACKDSPVPSQNSLQIVQDVMLSAVDEVRNQETQVHLVKQKVLKRVRRKLRDIIKQEQHKLGKQCLASSRETANVKQYHPCEKQTSVNSFEQSGNVYSTSVHNKLSEEPTECPITVGTVQNNSVHREQQTFQNNSKDTVKDVTHESLCANFHENMVEILFSGVIDELESEVNKREALRLALHQLHSHPFILAQGMTGEFSAFEVTTILESTFMTCILKETLEKMISTRRLRYKSHYLLPDEKNADPFLCEAMHHNLMSLRSSPEYLVSHLVMEVQEIALCRTVSSDSITPVEEQLSHIFKKTLHKAKFTSTRSVGENKSCQAAAALKMVGGFLEDEITTGRAILHHGYPLRNSTAMLTIDLLSRLQQQLNAELEKTVSQTTMASVLENEQQNMVTSDDTTSHHPTTTKLQAYSKRWPLCDLSAISNEEALNQSITDEVTKCLCDGVNELVEVGWKKSTSSLDLKNGDKNICCNVETLIMQTIDDVITKLQAQAVPTVEPSFMSKTLSSFQKRESIHETMIVPVIFYTCRTGVDCVQAILSVVRNNISQKYTFKPQVTSHMAFKNVTDGLVLRQGHRTTELASSLISPRHVPALGAKAVEESQGRNNKSYVPFVTITHMMHECPSKRNSQFPENTNFLPRIVPTPMEHFLHRVRHGCPWQLSNIAPSDSVSFPSLECATPATNGMTNTNDTDKLIDPHYSKTHICNDSTATSLRIIPSKPTLAGANRASASSPTRNFMRSLCSPLRATVPYPSMKVPVLGAVRIPDTQTAEQQPSKQDNSKTNEANTIEHSPHHD